MTTRPKRELIQLSCIVREMFVFLFFFAAVVLVHTSQTYAQSGPGTTTCLPGLPCVKLITPNLDFVDDYIPANDPDVADENATKSTSDRCDADFMNQIYNKAYLEAEEENIQLETLLPKPDSVLEYSCFENTLENAAEHVPIIFSESKRFHISYTQDPDFDYALLLMDGNTDDIYFPEADKHPDNDHVHYIMDYDNWDDEDYYLLYVFMGLDENANDEAEYDATYLGDTLEDMILSALKSADSHDGTAPNYIDANFSHMFLGGQTLLFNSHGNFGSNLEGNADAIMGTIGNVADLGVFDGEIVFEGEIDEDNNAVLDLSDPFSLDVNLCAHMRIVWYMAKCRGGELGRLGVTPTMTVYDGGNAANSILGFAEATLPGADSRIYPYPEEALTGCGGVDDITAEGIANTRNPRVLGTPLYAFFDPSRYNPFTLFPEFFEEIGPGACFQPVPTGVVVTTHEYLMSGFHVARSTDTHNEYICINPGCYYNGSTCVQ